MVKERINYMTAQEYYNNIHSVSLIYPSNGMTYCDRFAVNVMNKCGVEFPQLYGCNNILSRLKDGYSYWRECSYYQAQFFANHGYATIAIENGHVAVVTPNGNNLPSRKANVLVSQSGSSCFYDKTINYAWSTSSNRWDDIQFFFYNYKCESEEGCIEFVNWEYTVSEGWQGYAELLSSYPLSTIEWISTNDSVITITNNVGRIKAMSKGQAGLIATSPGCNIKTICLFKVE